MRYEARITAFDLLDQVHVALVVVDTSRPAEEGARTVLTLVDTLQGEGVSDPREWTRDALVSLLEAL